MKINIGPRYRVISNEEAFGLFKASFVPVRVVCQNTLACAIRKPSRWERFKAWLSDTADRIVHNGE